jgi:hypothetical protein
MYFLFSGEGPTDMGVGTGAQTICEGDSFLCGPMTVIVDQIIEERFDFSVLETQACGFVPKHRLVERASEFKQNRRSPRLPGKKTPKETSYFYRNARALALCAKDKQSRLNDDDVIAVLFRDSDSRNSSERGVWREKRASMMKGFEDAEFSKGVPMLPKPTSEAWVVCALKKNPYQGCAALEDRSGSEHAPNSLKGELKALLGEPPSRDKLCEMVRDRAIDHRRINMPSFTAFAERLRDVL